MLRRDLRLFLAVLFLIVGVVVFAFLAFRANIKPPDKLFLVRDQTFHVEIPRNEAEMELGLGGRDSLAERHAMLFIFPDAGNHPFWMKGMKFPIDIVWINGEQVVGFSENMRPEPGVPDERLQNYFPPAPADKVLEIPAGTVKEDGFVVGDKAILLAH